VSPNQCQSASNPVRAGVSAVERDCTVSICSFGVKCLETQLALQPAVARRLARMSNELPAQLLVWVECPRCGRIEKPVYDFQMPATQASTMIEKARIPCDRCGAGAMMYLRRTVSNVH
jgi:hypothetical protein